MEEIYRYITKKPSNSKEIIGKLGDFIDEGGNINHVFKQDYPYAATSYGTILHYSISYCPKIVVEFILSEGANIATELKIFEKMRLPLEIAVIKNRKPVFKILKQQSLEQYSSYNLTPLHLDCAMHIDNDSSVEETILRHLQTIDINATIAIDSPIWPAMTPLHIAAKFGRSELVTRLLDLGADPFACDLGGCNPVHYIDTLMQFYDERLFDFEGKNTFSFMTGESHFHVACRLCSSGNLSIIVKRFLDRGISPDLAIIEGEESDRDAGKTGLHIALETGNPELVRLLLEYGANVDIEDSRGQTPMEKLINDTLGFNNERFFQCIGLFVEAGSNMERVDIVRLHKFIGFSTLEDSQGFLECILRLYTLNEDLVPRSLMEVYLSFASVPVDGWNEAKYTDRCSEELEVLSGLGLRHLLDGSINVKSDFKSQFKFLDSFDFGSFKLYGDLLKMRYKRKLFELKSKKGKMRRGVAKIQQLFRSLVHLPHLCAEMIIWNLSDKELTLFVKEYVKV